MTKYNKLIFGLVGLLVGALVAVGAVSAEQAQIIERQLSEAITTLMPPIATLVGVYFGPKNTD